MSQDPILQNYSVPPQILGVQVFSPKQHKDCGGSFLEVLRKNNSYIKPIMPWEEDYCPNDPAANFCRFYWQQINYSLVHPGTVKAFHLHKIQSDFWFVVDKMIVNLIDEREKSPTRGFHTRLILENQAVFIPPGVYHGIGNPYNKDGHMMYITDQVFNPQDEFRKRWDYLGTYVWEIHKG